MARKQVSFAGMENHVPVIEKYLECKTMVDALGHHLEIVSNNCPTFGPVNRFRLTINGEFHYDFQDLGCLYTILKEKLFLRNNKC